MTGPPRTVSLGGADNVGKTTALEWLAIAAPGSQLVGSIDRWHPGWAAVAGKTFANWWFAESTTAEHVELVLASHQARRVASGTLAWEDRGEPMLLATCAATCVVKDGLAADDALDVVTTLARPHAAEPREELHILLRHTDRGPESEAALALARDPYPPGTWYAAYQRALAEILDLQTANGDYDAVLVRGDSSVLDVQRQLRAVLAEHGVPVRPLPASAPERVWALGGMSESGKSTAGELLAAEHGATRLKIGWLLQTAALRAGVTDPYDAWNERAQAAHLAEEILLFCAANKVDTLSVESLHRNESTCYLRQLLGPICQVVYFDAGPDVRAARTDEGAAELAARDAVKAGRGADRITELADIVLDNSGPLAGLKLALPSLGTVRAAGAPADWAPVTSRPWLEKVRRHLVDEDTALLLATGTTGAGEWRAGWSDLDLLLVRDDFPLEWLRTVPGTLPDSGGVKVGLTMLSTAELDGARVPPRVVHALCAAADGTGILHRRTEYLPPYPSGAADDRAARGELGLVLMTSRRLLAAALPDIRALHKHLVLIAKILLRAGGTDLDDADDVLTVFAQHHPAITGNSWMPAGPRPGAGALAVDVVAALAAAENPDPAAVDQLLAAVAAVVRLTDTLPATVLRRNL
jgi:hypothetical protein